VRFDAVGLLIETIESSSNAATKQGISIRSDTLEGSLPGTFDPERILQVLANLVTNALKFTPRGGTIHLRGERTGDELRFSVSDTGKGIPSHMLQAVFERFTQIENNGHRGLGLGLYISRCIVEAHGGRMWVESTLGEGSTFYVTIPNPAPRRTPTP
jgi:signal transduction histidine kinase